MEIRRLSSSIYRVVGDRGIPYIVQLSPGVECTCPHFQERQKYLGRVCEHVLSVQRHVDNVRRSENDEVPTSTKPSEQVAQAALEVLVAYGKAAHKSEVSRGTALGYAVYALDGRAHPIEEGTKPCVDVVVDTSMEMLEQWNGHLTVACIAAIEKGKGKVVRKGRTVTFTLPEHWERF